MARIRTVKPEFWTSEQVVACSLPARLLFLGLLNFVDDGGRMPFSLKRIKMQIFPADDFASTDIQRMLDELSSNALGEPLVAFYEVDDKRYLQITGWEKHQRIDRPTYQFPDRNGVIPQGKGFAGNGHARRTLDEASTPERKGKEGKGVEGKGKEGSRREGGSLTRTTRARAGPPANFHDDWPPDYRARFAEAYPHKVGMTAALDELDDARRKLAGTVSWRIVMAAIATYAETKPPERQWANPKTWITEERWNDRPAPQPVGNGRSRPSNADIAASLAAEAEERERGARDVASEVDGIGGAEIGGDHAQAS